MRKCLEWSANSAGTGVKLPCRRGEAAMVALKCLFTRTADKSTVLKPVKESMCSSSSGVRRTASRASANLLLSQSDR